MKILIWTGKKLQLFIKYLTRRNRGHPRVSPVFRRPYVPTTLYFDVSVFIHHYVPTSLYSNKKYFGANKNVPWPREKPTWDWKSTLEPTKCFRRQNTCFRASNNVRCRCQCTNEPFPKYTYYLLLRCITRKEQLSMLLNIADHVVLHFLNIMLICTCDSLLIENKLFYNVPLCSTSADSHRFRRIIRQRQH